MGSLGLVFLPFIGNVNQKNILKFAHSNLTKFGRNPIHIALTSIKASKKKKVSPSSYFIENFKKTFATICILKTEGHLLQDVCKTAKSSMLL